MKPKTDLKIKDKKFIRRTVIGDIHKHDIAVLIEHQENLGFKSTNVEKKYTLEGEVLKGIFILTFEKMEDNNETN